MAPLPQWLRETRRRHAMPENGRPWTQDYFLEQIRTATGWAPGYANYNRYEQGKSIPRADTRARLVAFWESLGEPAPDFDAEPEPVDTRDPMTRLADAIEAQTKEASSGKHTPEDASLADLVGELRIQNGLMATLVGMLASERQMPAEARAVLDEMVARATAPSTSARPISSPRP